MNSPSTATAARRGPNWRALGWGTAVMLLLLPFFLILFTGQPDWNVGDFVFVGLLLGIVGVTIELTVRASGSGWYRLGAAAALAASALIIVATGAVGMIGSEDHSYNLLFFGVIGLALLGAVLARFRAKGMARAMAAAATAQIGLGLFGTTIDPLGGILSAGLGGLWLVSAAGFWMAGRDRMETSA